MDLRTAILPVLPESDGDDVTPTECSDTDADTDGGTVESDEHGGLTEPEVCVCVCVCVCVYTHTHTHKSSIFWIVCPASHHVIC